MPLLTVDHVKKVYNTKLGLARCVALTDVSFSVEEGEFVAIMGASGSGKTTLLNLLASLDKPTEGEIRLDGHGFSEIKEKEIAQFRRDNLGFVFQDFNLLDTFTLKDNILLPLVLQGKNVKEMEDKVRAVAQTLAIEKLLDKYPYEVSGGEKQRAAIARAVITNPRILLADEPTGALDSKASLALLNTFESLNRDGHTLLMVTHSAMAASFAGRVLFIKDGEIFAQLYKGDQNRRAFFDRIVGNLAVLMDGGALSE
jgi:putative ABC transport system ATP-binding protein